ncbi:c-type cytochrome [Amorphus orientalis]|uniref:Mono/diheme cytochrome c family protein n=1 Tax=Amorphus orientalis TaxID=649198 RepID=A0AAE4ASD4_9HYPH|nr:cytochrome c [Amorphus orientalis]MDQ0316136.1 mono/diheme cytochrome c family protein [Amorphus orientalis]
MRTTRLLGLAGGLVLATALFWQPVNAQDATPSAPEVSDAEAAPDGPTPMDEAAASPDAVAEGRALAIGNCGGCHATGLEDESPLAEAPPFRTLGWNYPVRYLQESLAEGIVTGHDDMPEVAWDPGTIGVFLAYLESIQVPKDSE